MVLQDLVQQSTSVCCSPRLHKSTTCPISRLLAVHYACALARGQLQLQRG